MILSSVQSPADSAPLTATQVLLAIAALFLLALIAFLPVLVQAWKAAHRPSNVVPLTSRNGVRVVTQRRSGESA